MDAAPRNALPEGYTLEGYEIVRVLGHGGFGITYLAKAPETGRPVAIKEFLPAELAVRDESSSVHPKSSDVDAPFRYGRERFVQEAQTLARFEHPNVVAVHRFFEALNTAYMVMDFEDGETLAAILEEEETLEHDELLDILTPLLDALELIHDKGYLHRDIKPSNIVVRRDGAPVLLDFGSARFALGEKTRALTTIVTAGYSPFEQYQRSVRPKAATDIYALAAVLYHCVAGIKPPDAPDRLHRDRYVPAGEAADAAGGDYPAHFLRAIDLALRVRLDERPQSIAEWRPLLLEPWSDGAEADRPPADDRSDGAPSEDRTREVAAIAPRAMWWPWAVATGVFTVLAAVAVVAALQWERAEQLAARAASLEHQAAVLRAELDERAAGEARLTAAIHACDRLAADPYDPGHVGLGVRWSALDPTEALDACEQAAADYPETVRFAAQLGRVLFAMGRDTAAVERLRDAAERGSPTAMYHLAWAHDFGYGVEADVAEAFRWYLSAARAGHAPAQLNAGVMLAAGEGVPRNQAEAVRWIRAASAQGLSDAEAVMGTFHREGRGVRRDLDLAFTWYMRAASGNDYSAAENLGEMFVRGEAVPVDCDMAYFWFTLAIALGNDSAAASRREADGCVSAAGRSRAARMVEAWTDAR